MISFVFGMFIGSVVGMVITSCLSVEKIENIKRINGELIYERNEAIRELRRLKDEWWIVERIPKISGIPNKF